MAREVTSFQNLKNRIYGEAFNLLETNGVDLCNVQGYLNFVNAVEAAFALKEPLVIEVATPLDLQQLRRAVKAKKKVEKHTQKKAESR